ncbi:NUDIX hydrolase [Nocardiopsis coralliicola]
MATPDFILELRKRVGHDLLFLTGVTGVVIAPDGSVLLHQRADDGSWAPPGGILEPGEQPAAALVREIREETGIEAAPERVVSIVTEEPFTYANGDRVQFLDVAFRCSPLGGELRTDDEETLDVAWFAPDALPELKPHVLRRVRCAQDDAPAYYAGPAT